MSSFPAWQDDYLMTKNRIVYTHEQLHIPGIRMFGYHNLNHAINSLPWHYHENCFEFSVPAGGTFTFSTLSSNYDFSGGDVFVSFPNEVHGTNETPVTLGGLYWFQLDVSDENQFLFLKPEAARSVISSLKTITHHVIHTEIEKAFPLIEKAFHYAPQEEFQQMAATLVSLFLHVVILSSKEEPFQTSDDIKLSLAYIHEHITEDLPLEQLASVAALSCSQFKQKFKKQLGIAPRHYINREKVEYAKTLLLEDHSITETAMLLNFTTSGYFSTVFKKYALYTPHDYIKRSKLYTSSPEAEEF